MDKQFMELNNLKNKYLKSDKAMSDIIFRYNYGWRHIW
jgi:hypothetical protein